MGRLTDDECLDIVEDDGPDGVADGGRPAPGTRNGGGRCWRILLVDDDEAVHSATAFSLTGTEILGRRLELVHALSGGEALDLLRRDGDFAVILLDVVMESADAGLQLVRRVREELGLSLPRIILRTGQPGYAPELTVIRDYDINDYRTKAEMTRARLLTSLHAALRTYSHIQALEASRRGLEQIIGASAELFRHASLRAFCDGVLTQIAGLLDIDARGLVIARMQAGSAGPRSGDPLILAAAGPHRDLSGRPLAEVPDEVLKALLRTALERRSSVFHPDATVLHIGGRSGDDLAVYLATERPPDPIDRKLLDVFSSNVALGFDNVSLLDGIRRMAFFDSVTRLPNRASFLDAVDQGLSQRSGTAGCLMVLLIDLDHFQALNDGLGHSIGDDLLVAVAERLGGVLPASALLSRITGDTFGVLAALPDGTAARRLIGAVEQVFAGPFLLDGHPIAIGASGGYALDDGGTDAHRLFRRAGMALKAAKREGRGRVLAFDPTMEATLRDRLSLVRRIPEALETGQFSLVFQPQVRLSEGSVTGAEALLRWRHPDGGSVPPDRFIPVAEDSGHILRLGEWVLRQACEHQARWRDGAVGRLRIAVNVSVRQLRDGHAVGAAERALAASGADPADIELEITESHAMENDQVLASARALRDMGFSIAIDDFGTGHSSLSRLQQLPASLLKIDRSFVRDIDRRRENRSIAAAIVKMGHAFGLDVLAEGVEVPAQEEVLRALGCDAVQGFLYAPPLPADAFERWLLNGGPNTPAAVMQAAPAGGH
ncbi:GGDEF/EAL domain-containing response regulator [Azospirillum halopraeferens]|uniref:GGDEF/EAL domain-containing response regulator n=1 Tax=Azospirillum halopraeferens TaxID=34010 RepID=UPI00041B377D|nr:EAL domain-containing protein [Azospirillum halopraeferens]